MNSMTNVFRSGGNYLNHYWKTMTGAFLILVFAMTTYLVGAAAVDRWILCKLAFTSAAGISIAFLVKRCVAKVLSRITLPTLPRWITLGCYVVAFLFALIDPAFAGGFDKVTENVTNIQTMLKGVAIVVVTIAIIIAGYKIAFSGARLQDVAGILIGGTLIGGASALAAWIATPDG